MKRLVGVFTVVSLSLMGCGGNLCDDMAKTVDTLNTKTQPCGVAAQPAITDAQINTCKDNLDKCTDSDKKAYEDMIDCLDKLATCSTATQQEFGTALLACAAKADGVSAACSTAISPSSISNVASYSPNVSR